MKNYKMYLAATLLILQGCATPGMQSVQLQDYLQPYLGQPADQIQQNLDLRNLGFQTLKQPQRNNQNLIFTILRPINIPVPMNMGISDGSRLSTNMTYGQSYDVNFYCHIIFELDQQQIARAIRYEGKAC
ncbi:MULTISPECIES: hypothetical protein [Acinetobacter]|uniref:Lipoprotein n=1 Tax=Acinetobacter colistiniresistens TaxID=280145 RepID=S3TIL0_9GAMM|nr:MULTISPECIES: hypothetical protein [Acinetobacter]EPG35515.1 hypothetical protein F907_02883 [Acinetobacter colistiniresistens]TVT84264.1 hypothetical protein FPV60_06615 [Acinetobacter colistiniresistens]UUM27793.1 hypothetical protein NQU59_01140 [Acinetobacter colistiniresistens]